MKTPSSSAASDAAHRRRPVRHDGVKAAIEPIRSAEVSFVHTVAEANAYIEAVDHPGVGHINGDVYHMQSEEAHIGEAILRAGDRLMNLHMADSNRCALGDGSLDLDTLIMALYVIGYNTRGPVRDARTAGTGRGALPGDERQARPASSSRHSSCDSGSISANVRRNCCDEEAWVSERAGGRDHRHDGAHRPADRV